MGVGDTGSNTGEDRREEDIDGTWTRVRLVGPPALH